VGVVILFIGAAAGKVNGLHPFREVSEQMPVKELRCRLLGGALDAAQAEATRSGASEMSLDQINAEISAYRRERRAENSG
jgi:hypothetical protein